MPYFLFLKKQRKLILSSAANHKWHFMGQEIRVGMNHLNNYGRYNIFAHAVHLDNLKL